MDCHAGRTNSHITTAGDAGERRMTIKKNSIRDSTK